MSCTIASLKMSSLTASWTVLNILMKFSLVAKAWYGEDNL